MDHTLRIATSEDLPPLHRLLTAMHSGTVVGTSPLDLSRLEAALDYSVSRGEVLVAEVDGEIVGSIAWMECSDWWSTELYLADRWFFVYKGYRNSRVALTLVRGFLEVGRAAGIKVRMGHVYSGDLARKDKFYGRLGLTKVGSLYVEV